jgi:multidrug efflux pump subunit AcrA (membrane-fusion protein)
MVACSKEQPKKVEIRPVRVTSVQHTSSGDTISLTDQIQAKDPVNLAFRIGGRLQERNVTVGDPVSPGQIVARIETQDYQNALRSAEVDLASAHAVLANAQATESRQSELLSKGFATRVQYDQAEQQSKTTQAQVVSAQAKLRRSSWPLAFQRRGPQLRNDLVAHLNAEYQTELARVSSQDVGAPLTRVSGTFSASTRDLSQNGNWIRVSNVDYGIF